MIPPAPGVKSPCARAGLASLTPPPASAGANLTHVDAAGDLHRGDDGEHRPRAAREAEQSSEPDGAKDVNSSFGGGALGMVPLPRPFTQWSPNFRLHSIRSPISLPSSRGQNQHTVACFAPRRAGRNQRWAMSPSSAKILLVHSQSFGITGMTWKFHFLPSITTPWLSSTRTSIPNAGGYLVQVV